MVEVEAIEDGKIVRVSEEYARREGLRVLRKPLDLNSGINAPAEGQFARDTLMRRRKEKLNLDRYRRPLDYRKNNVVSELKDNFHWEISKMRRERTLTRKQVAGAVGCSEEEIKMLEQGLLSKDDFVLISKVEKFFGINLRKDKNLSAVSEPEEKKEDKKDSLEIPDLNAEMFGDNIDVVEIK